MSEIMLNTDSVRSAIQDLKSTSGEMDAKLIRVNETLINIMRNWKSPRIQRIIEHYDVWSAQYKKQNEQFFAIVQELEAALQNWESANR